LEEPFGFYGFINPVGHDSMYFERICAETPIKLRRCGPGEMGAVIARYEGIGGYDWLAVPLVPYLYAVEYPSEVPARITPELLVKMREKYRQAHLLSLGDHLFAGHILNTGGVQLLGASYKRRIYAFRFATTAAQDDALIAQLNSGPNRTHYDMVVRNCADYTRLLLNFYFPHTFHHSIFPDAGMTTPKQIASQFVRYAHQHPETELTVFEIPEIPGIHHKLSANRSVAESFVTNGYAIPLLLVSPYITGGFLADFAIQSCFRVTPRHPQVLGPGNLSILTAPTLTALAGSKQNPDSAGIQAPGAAVKGTSENAEPVTTNLGLGEIKATHE